MKQLRYVYRTCPLILIVTLLTAALSECRAQQIDLSKYYPRGGPWGSEVQLSAEQTPLAAVVRDVSQYPSIQAAIDSLPPTGGIVFLPNGRYDITETINLTHRDASFVRIEGSGRNTIVYGRTGGKPVIDLSGSSHCQLANFRMVGLDCDVGILLARNAKDHGSAGAHNFYNLMLDGQYSKATIYSLASETNRYFGCFIANRAEGGYCFYMSDKNHLKVKSPYMEIVGGVNTETHFYGCEFEVQGERGVGIHIGPTEDFSIHGGMLAAKYLDDIGIVMNGPVQRVQIHGLRMECNGGKHCLYVKGDASQISISMGTWLCASGAPIRHEGPGTADSWRLGQLSLQVWDWLEYGKNYVPYPKGKHGYIAAEFDSLKDSELDITETIFHIEKDGKKWVHTTGTPVVVHKRSEGNQFTVNRREDVVFDCKPVGTSITALNEGGVKRRYLGTITGSELLNMVPQDVTAIAHPRQGDIALDNGSNTGSGELGLAVFDGESWKFMN